MNGIKQPSAFPVLKYPSISNWKTCQNSEICLGLPHICPKKHKGAFPNLCSKTVCELKADIKLGNRGRESKTTVVS